MTEAVAVVGPTASGKTSLAIAIAERLGTEIVSADSMQFYRGMEIGTAAPTPDELARVKHHFVGFLHPDEAFSAGEYERSARAVVADLKRRGKPAVVVGGSGLYVRALIDGLFPGPGKDESIRERLREEAERVGVGPLYERLRATDPDYALIIEPGDLRRIVRAIEVYELTGKPLSQLHAEHRARADRLDAVQIALDWPRERLYERINARVDAMLAVGLVDEVRRLLEAGYSEQIDRLRSLGYREVMAYLRGETPFGEAVELMKRATRRYAKRQLTWFRKDKRIHWFPADDETTVEAYAERALALIDTP